MGPTCHRGPRLSRLPGYLLIISLATLNYLPIFALSSLCFLWLRVGEKNLCYLQVKIKYFFPIRIKVAWSIEIIYFVWKTFSPKKVRTQVRVWRDLIVLSSCKRFLRIHVHRHREEWQKMAICIGKRESWRGRPKRILSIPWHSFSKKWTIANCLHRKGRGIWKEN